MRPPDTASAGANSAGRRDLSPRHGLLRILHERLRCEAYSVPAEDVAASIIARAVERRPPERPE